MCLDGVMSLQEDKYPLICGLNNLQTRNIFEQGADVFYCQWADRALLCL